MTAKMTTIAVNNIKELMELNSAEDGLISAHDTLFRAIHSVSAARRMTTITTSEEMVERQANDSHENKMLKQITDLRFEVLARKQELMDTVIDNAV